MNFPLIFVSTSFLFLIPECWTRSVELAFDEKGITRREWIEEWTLCVVCHVWFSLTFVFDVTYSCLTDFTPSITLLRLVWLDHPFFLFFFLRPQFGFNLRSGTAVIEHPKTKKTLISLWNWGYIRYYFSCILTSLLNVINKGTTNEETFSNFKTSLFIDFSHLFHEYSVTLGNQVATPILTFI